MNVASGLDERRLRVDKRKEMVEESLRLGERPALGEQRWKIVWTHAVSTRRGVVLMEPGHRGPAIAGGRDQVEPDMGAGSLRT